MCRPISGIITKDKILFSEIEHSHTAILEEYGIENSRKNAETLFVRAELYPQNQDMFSSIADWKFNVDQDIIPEWFVKEHEELRMREAVKVYAQNYIHVGKNCFELSSGLHWIKDCKNVSLLGSAKVKQLISSQVGEMRGSSQVGEMRESSQVGMMWESSQVGEMWESLIASVISFRPSANSPSSGSTAVCVSSVFGFGVQLSWRSVQHIHGFPTTLCLPQCAHIYLSIYSAPSSSSSVPQIRDTFM